MPVALIRRDNDLALAYAGANFGLGGLRYALWNPGAEDYRAFFEDYRQVLSESIEIYRRLGCHAEIARILIFIGFGAQNGGYFDEAEANLIEGIALYRDLEDSGGMAFGLLALGEMEYRRRSHSRAVEVLNESLDLFRSVEDSRGIAAATGTLAATFLRQRNLDRASELLRDSLRVRHEIGDLSGLPWNFERLAERSMAGSRSTESAVRAARLLGAAKGLRDRTGSWIYLADQPDYERLVASIQQRLSEVAFIAAWEAGRVMNLGGAVAYGLEPDIDDHISAPLPTSLSRREQEVLCFLVDGRSNQDIADALFISPHTVANHVTSIMNKLGVDSRTAAATWAVKQGVG